MVTLIETNDKYLFFEMAKLTKKWASPEFGDFGKIVYFSPKNHSAGPRVKFGGGTPKTDQTRYAPTLEYTKEKTFKLRLQNWHNRDNCPNAFDSEYVKKVENFVSKTIAILLFVWFNKLDESDALAYFVGKSTFKEVISDIINIPENHYLNIQTLETLDELYDYGMKNDLFKF